MRPTPAAPSATLSWARLLQIYYLATPLFAALDLGWGINVRAVFLGDLPGLRLAYYLVAFACGIAVRRWPRQAAQMALVESGTNIALLVLGVGATYIAALDAAVEGAPLPAALSGGGAMNLALSAAVLATAHLVNQARLASRPQ
jgi:hypothetical protein